MSSRVSLSALFVFFLLWSGAPALFDAPATRLQAQPFSIILEGGTVYDGTGAAPRTADVGLRGDRVAAIGDLAEAEAEQRIDVSGLAVVPGFIDIHSHATSSSWDRSDIQQRPLAESYLRQGVTTALGGQDGSSPIAIGDYLSRLEDAPPAINVGVFVGHGTVRGRVMGAVDRAPHEAEREEMRTLVRRAMEEGAFGLSSGLEYTPGAYAETEELIELARVTAPYRGLYISHIRDEGGQLLESVDEVIQVAEAAGVAGQVTHHKVVGPDRWGNSAASLERIEAARARGVDVTSDVYPYAASSTGLTILFPDWSREGGGAALNDRLSDPDVRPRVGDAITRHLNTERGGDPSTIVLSRCAWDASLDGKSLADVLDERGRPVTVEAAAELAMDLQAQGGCRVVLHSMAEEDVRRIMQHPTTMIASDGGIPAPGVGAPHPRSYGTFARVLGHYVREERVLSMPEAIHKMTGFPARRLRLANRGTLEEGAVADVAVFNPDTITDHATFADPHQFASGVEHVFVSGEAVLRDGEVTGARPGRVLRATTDTTTQP
jgi:dihydroorotase/N-acyl-D-amino-acid deacylase